MTVKNFRVQQEEKIQYITPDGVIYDLHSPPDRYVMMLEGDGMPDVSYSTTRGPYQHGMSVVEARLEPRTIDLIVRQIGGDRNSYWEMRSLMDGILRPNRTNTNNPSPGILRRVLSNGEIRDLDCYVTKGPIYKMNTVQWDAFSIQEILRFTGFNPIEYDPNTLSVFVQDFTPVPPNQQQLVFPFVFPFAFDFTYTIVSKSFAVNYEGNWEEYPSFQITGPITNLKIAHQELGLFIDFTPYDIPAGTVITIDLTYSRKTLLDNFGVSWIGKLTEDSNLGTFRIEADPLVVNGVNTFIFTGILGDTNTRIDMFYKNRYIGVD